MDENMMIHPGRGLVDLIAGVTPTFYGWTVDPTDASDITDGDISTFCTTGNKVTDGAWQYAYFEWDLGTFYNVACTLTGCAAATAGVARGFIWFCNGSDWVKNVDAIIYDEGVKTSCMVSSRASKIRLGISASVAATVTPNIREFHAWRL